VITRRELLKSAVAVGFASISDSSFAANQQNAFSSSFANVNESIGPTLVKFNRALPKDLMAMA